MKALLVLRGVAAGTALRLGPRPFELLPTFSVWANSECGGSLDQTADQSKPKDLCILGSTTI